MPLVSADFRQYLNSFLYSLALLWEVDTPLIELSDRASEAAFGLATVFSEDQPPKGEFPEEGSEGEEHADMVMEWDEPLMSLPPELTYLWTGANTGDRRLNLAQVLVGAPRFREIPGKAPENNHRQDGKNFHDRQLKTYQQSILQLLRLLGAAYTNKQESVIRFN